MAAIQPGAAPVLTVMRRHPLVLLLPIAALLLLTAGCAPAPVEVSVRNNFFAPQNANANRGDTVRWTNDGSVRHTTTGDSPLNLWNQSLNPSQTFSQKLVAAGTYAYHCTVHFGMSGSVKVPLAVSPSSGGSSTTFTISVASATAPSGFRYVVQKMNPGGSFQNFKTVTTSSTTFSTTAPGTYQFRSALQRASNSATSGFSDSKSITVS
jgi:plastocyanin